VDKGTLALNGKTIMNWNKEAYGRISMTEVIEHSVNTGSAFAAREIGVAAFRDYIERFGFGKPTGVTLPGELKGSLATIQGNPREINLATASFGQGVSVTPLQLVAAVSAIANGGVLMRPYLVASDGPSVVRRVVAEDTAAKVIAMMVNAVEKNIVARVPSYTVAGKTGTAQVPDFKRGGYSEDYVHTYAGFAPASDPKFTVLIKLDRPKGALLAGATVVPAFKELAEFLLSYMQVAPDALPASAKVQ
jgi:cell division protein FtsI/penicillin-binding protein 2